jgi:hypothetical protein
MPADTNPLPLLPSGNTGPKFVDDACDFVSWNTGILNSGPVAFFREDVTVANTTSLNLDAHVSWVRHRNLALDDFEIGSGL